MIHHYLVSQDLTIDHFLFLSLTGSKIRVFYFSQVKENQYSIKITKLPSRFICITIWLNQN